MEKQRRCTIAGITVHLVYQITKLFKRARGFDASQIIKQQTSDQDHVNLSSCSLVDLELASLFNTPKHEPSDGTTPSMTKDMKNSKSCSVSYGCGLYPC